MRIAVLIISAVVFVLMFLQSCAGIMIGGVQENLASEAASETQQMASMGFLAALVSLVALAFVWGYPFVSMIIYIMAALIAFAAAAAGFNDMQFWGYVLLVLAVLSFFGWREKRKKVKEVVAAPPLPPPTA